MFWYYANVKLTVYYIILKRNLATKFSLKLWFPRKAVIAFRGYDCDYSRRM